jgi:hypothetical protein
MTIVDYTTTKYLFTITPTGNVGIGTSSPRTKFDVLGSGSQNTAGDALGEAIITGANYNPVSTANGNLFIQTNEAQAANQGGSIAFGARYDGTTAAAGFAMIKGAKENSTSGNLAGYLSFYTRDNALGILERMRITSGGNVLIGATSTGAYFDGIINAFGSGTTPAACFKNDGTSGQITSSFWNALGSGDNIFMDFVTETSYTKRGSISFNRSAGLVVYNTTSDYRLKSEISDFNALNIIDNLKPKEFRIGDAVNKSIGFIAHELQEYLPQAVSGKKDAIDKDGNPIYQSVDYSQLTGLLVKAIQELKAEIETLKIK